MRIHLYGSHSVGITNCLEHLHTTEPFESGCRLAFGGKIRQKAYYKLVSSPYFYPLVYFYPSPSLLLLFFPIFPTGRLKRRISSSIGKKVPSSLACMLGTADLELDVY